MEPEKSFTRFENKETAHGSNLDLDLNNIFWYSLTSLKSHSPVICSFIVYLSKAKASR